MIEDAEKRINLLFDQLNNQEVPQPVVDELLQLSKGIFY
jgi:hypothetical protein